MGNRCHDRLTGRFISRSRGRVQNIQQLADLPDEEWATDEQALVILEGGIALAIRDGWVPPGGVEVSS